MMRMRIRNTGDQVNLFLSIILLLPLDQIHKQCRLMRVQIWIKNTEKKHDFYILAKHPHLLNLSESALVGSSVLKERTWKREAANLRLWLIRLM
jgi:hypothetical protein